MVDAQGPDLEVGEDPVDPGQDDMSGHLTDDMGLVGEAGGAGISGPTIGLGGSAGGEIGGEEGMKAGGRGIGHLAQADAAGAAVRDLRRAGDQHFALMAAPATAGGGSVFASASDLGFSTSTRPASGLRPGASMLR